MRLTHGTFFTDRFVTTPILLWVLCNDKNFATMGSISPIRWKPRKIRCFHRSIQSIFRKKTLYYETNQLFSVKLWLASKYQLFVLHIRIFNYYDSKKKSPWLSSLWVFHKMSANIVNFIILTHGMIYTLRYS